MADQVPSGGRWLRGTLATVGAVKTGIVWAGSAAGRAAFRAASIRTSVGVASSVGVSRSTAVFVGTRASNYVNGGLIPGALTALAVYDGWCLARWAYNWYNSDNQE